MATAEVHGPAAQSLLVGTRLPVAPFLAVSLLGHVALFAAIGAASYLQLGPRVDLNQQPIKASLVRLGKPRDAKLLPRLPEEIPDAQQKASVPEPPKPQEPKPVAIPDTKAVSAAPPKKSPDHSSADRRKQLLNAFGRSSKVSGSRTVRTIEELEGQPEGDPNGDSATQEGERYFGLLRAQVQQHYDVSQTIPEQERLHLKAQVLVQIGRTGEVLRVQLAKASGNQLFDNSVVNAVKKASPFSPPPEHLRDALQQRGIALEFRP